jgi:hypothetical protein
MGNCQIPQNTWKHESFAGTRCGYTLHHHRCEDFFFSSLLLRRSAIHSGCHFPRAMTSMPGMIQSSVLSRSCDLSLIRMHQIVSRDPIKDCPVGPFISIRLCGFHAIVPWNNNNAEHAIKAFVRLRRSIGGAVLGKWENKYGQPKSSPDCADPPAALVSRIPPDGRGQPLYPADHTSVTGLTEGTDGLRL